jgi:hypothetical protein
VFPFPAFLAALGLRGVVILSHEISAFCRVALYDISSWLLAAGFQQKTSVHDRLPEGTSYELEAIRHLNLDYHHSG